MDGEKIDPLLIEIATEVAIDAQTFGIPHHSEPASLNSRLRGIIRRVLAVESRTPKLISVGGAEIEDWEVNGRADGAPAGSAVSVTRHHSDGRVTVHRLSAKEARALAIELIRAAESEVIV